jgi:hypothetical protein
MWDYQLVVYNNYRCSITPWDVRGLRELKWTVVLYWLYINNKEGKVMYKEKRKKTKYKRKAKLDSVARFPYLKHISFSLIYGWPRELLNVSLHSFRSTVKKVIKNVLQSSQVLHLYVTTVETGHIAAITSSSCFQ